MRSLRIFSRYFGFYGFFFFTLDYVNFCSFLFLERNNMLFDKGERGDKLREEFRYVYI